jgi:hypothetical protein
VKAAAAEVKAGSPSDDPQPVYWASPSLSDPSSPFAGTDGARSADWRVRGLHALRISTRHRCAGSRPSGGSWNSYGFRPTYISHGFVIRPGFSVKDDPFHWRKTTPFSQTGK